MSHELIYTSAPAGLKPGARGFCTVAQTAGLSNQAVQRLELLSGYVMLYPPGDPHENQNPVAFAHWRPSIAGRTQSLLSRIAPAGMDYTGRSNTLAHHILLETSEQCAAGPAWLLAQPGLLEEHWQGEPRVLPASRTIPAGDDPPAICAAWQQQAGDAGWAGILAETALDDATRVAYIIYPAGVNTLELLRQAMALLPPPRRWEVTFCTYFTDLPAGLTCTWRCCVAGTEAANEAKRFCTSGLIIDLTHPLGQAPDTALAQAARSGVLPQVDDATTVILPAPPTDADTPTKVLTVKRRMVFDPVPVYTGTEPPASPDEADQSWMPPVSATAIESTATTARQVRTGKPDRRKAVLWAVAVLWPVVVALGLIMWHSNADSSRNQEFAQKLTTQQADWKGQTETLQKQLAEATKNRGDVDLQVKQLGAKNEQLQADLDAAKQAATTAETATDAANKLADDLKVKMQTDRDKADAVAGQLTEQLAKLKNRLQLSGNPVCPAPDPFSKDRWLWARWLWAPLAEEIKPNRIELIGPKTDRFTAAQPNGAQEITVNATDKSANASFVLEEDGVMVMRKLEVSGDTTYQKYLDTDAIEGWLQASYIQVFQGPEALARVPLYQQQPDHQHVPLEQLADGDGLLLPGLTPGAIIYLRIKCVGNNKPPEKNWVFAENHDDPRHTVEAKLKVPPENSTPASFKVTMELDNSKVYIRSDWLRCKNFAKTKAKDAKNDAAEKLTKFNQAAKTKADLSPQTTRDNDQHAVNKAANELAAAEGALKDAQNSGKDFRDATKHRDEAKQAKDKAEQTQKEDTNKIEDAEKKNAEAQKALKAADDANTNAQAAFTALLNQVGSFEITVEAVDLSHDGEPIPLCTVDIDPPAVTAPATRK